MFFAPGSKRGRRSSASAVVVAIGALAGSLPAQPGNDSCQSAPVLKPGTVVGTTTNSTNDGAAPCGASGGSPDVWYRYTAASSGTAVITTCAKATNFDSVLSVHTACPGSIANEIACNDDSCGFDIVPSTLSFPVGAGNDYFIRVAGYNSEVGEFELTLTPPPDEPGDPPANDDCADAIAVGNGIHSFSTLGATTDSPASCGSNGRDIWCSYTATASGSVQVDTCTGTAYDSVIGVYAGACGGLTELGCNDDNCSTQSVVQFNAVSGTTYLISVGGWNSEVGTGSLRIGTGPEPSDGADVIMRDCDSVTNWGAVGAGSTTAQSNRSGSRGARTRRAPGPDKGAGWRATGTADRCSARGARTCTDRRGTGCRTTSAPAPT
jgi:hypothetical protein